MSDSLPAVTLFPLNGKNVRDKTRGLPLSVCADRARALASKPADINLIVLAYVNSRPSNPRRTQHAGATFILANDLKRVFADIYADDGDCITESLRHGVLLV